MGENKMTFKVGTVVGANDGWWSQVHHFSQLTPEKLAKRGEMVVVLGLKVPEASGVDVVAVGREVLGRINEEYYGVTDGQVWQRLTETIVKVAKESLEMDFGGFGGQSQDQKSEVSVKITDLSISAGVFFGNVWYLGGCGKGQMWIQRNGQVGMVFGGGSEFWGGSGRIYDGDQIIFGTGGFFDQVGQGVIRAALVTGSIEEAVNILAPVVGGKQGGEGMAAATVGFEKTEEFSTVSETMGQEKAFVETRVEKGFGEKVGATLSGILSPVREKIGGIGGRFGRGIYIKSYRPPGPGKRGTFAIGIFLLVLILGSIIFGIKVQRERLEAEGPIGQTREKISQAKDLMGLSPERARSTLAEARVLAESVGEKKTREEFLLEIQSLSDQVSGIAHVTPEVFLDLKLLREDLTVTDSFWTDGVWWGLDSAAGRLSTVVTKNKQAKVVSGQEQVGAGEQVTAIGGKAYILNEKGITEIDIGQKTRTVVTRDKDWGKIVEVGSFGGNLYLLDEGSSIVWRYPAIEGGFGGKQRWFGTGVKPDLSQAVGMAIDGSVWIALGDGRVLKFTQGIQEPFNLTGMNVPITKLTSIFTSADLNNIYLLDGGAGRIIIFSKNGEYVSQVVSPVIQQGSGIAVVDESGKQILFSTVDKILEVRL